VKKVLSVVLVAAVVLAAAGTSDARGGGGHGGHGGHGGGHSHGHKGSHGGHRHGFIGGGPIIFWPSVPGWPGYPPNEYEPPVFVEPLPQGYWYYCQSAGVYYPHVYACPDGWIRVAPHGP